MSKTIKELEDEIEYYREVINELGEVAQGLSDKFETLLRRPRSKEAKKLREHDKLFLKMLKENYNN